MIGGGDLLPEILYQADCVGEITDLRSVFAHSDLDVIPSEKKFN